MRPHLRLLLAITALALTVLPARPASAAPLPVDWNWGRNFTATAGKMNTPPPGANNWSCRSARHPRPVVLVHGTFENQANNWAAYAPYLTNNGFCVYTFNYGVQLGLLPGFKSIKKSAAELKTFIETVVLPRTGATQVDVVGHSQGGMMPRYYIKYLGGWATIHALVGISPSNHGTSLSGLAGIGAALGVNPVLALTSPGLIDQTTGSPFMQELQKCWFGLPDADICPLDPVKYTVITTTEDRIVTPYTNAFLQGATNITIQKVCPLDDTGHNAFPYDRNAAFQVLKALDPRVTGTVCVKTTALNGG